jgi:hypothetical protein
MGWSLSIGQVLNTVLTGAGVGAFLALAWLAGNLIRHTGPRRVRHHRFCSCSGIPFSCQATAHDKGYCTVNTFRGIAMDAWVDVDEDCPIHGEVVSQQAQIELGHGAGSLHVVLTEEGLANLVQVLIATLTDMRSVSGRSASYVDARGADSNS